MRRSAVAPALEFRSVSKSYARRGRYVRALAPLSLSVRPGELVCLLGRNGSGKTTALKIAATLVAPTSGAVFVLGSRLSASPAATRRSVGAVFSPLRSFYLRLTAGHNLSFFAALQGIGPREAAARVRDVSSELGLSEHLGTPARRLSAGTLARLAVARALLHRPALLLLDEPFASMDPASSELTWRALVRRAESGLAAVIATHSDAHVSRCGRQVAVDLRS